MTTQFLVRHYDTVGDPTGDRVVVEEATALPRAVRHLLDKGRIGGDAVRVAGIQPTADNTRIVSVEIHLADGTSLTYQR